MKTTSAAMGDNCTHGSLFWYQNWGQPQYAFTYSEDNVGTTFNDKAQSARANL